MNLTLIGLILSFCGSIILLVDTLLNMGKSKTIFTPIYLKGGKIKYNRMKRVEGINDGWGGYKDIKISKEEIILIISLGFLGGGFFLQILGLFI